ncbi:hypothetical protein MMC26_007789 [Xylographa opegraphella]|nr:hypothetical protein [Xylographa opegraphella]
MGVVTSNLSNAKYGYDIVVATTQASLNSTLWEWLCQAKQPVSYICFLNNSNPRSGHPMIQITLDKLLTLTGGVNPFEIPDQTPPSDPRIAALTKANFAGGLKMQMGIPPGTMPKDLPIVVLGNSASEIQFTMYCSQLYMVQNHQSTWAVSTQPPGSAWFVRTHVGLVSQDLDVTLNVPYFQNSGSKHKAALLAKVNVLKKSGNAFSLQQLLFDLDHASMTNPTPFFVPENSIASRMIIESFIPTYIASIEQHGSPILSVKALSPTSTIPQLAPIEEYIGDLFIPLKKVVPESDPSVLALTGLEWEVSPLFNVANPTPAQQDATTLNYLCAVNGHQLAAPAAFDWNWVEPSDVDTESGIIAINRNVIANHVLQELLPIATACCVKADFSTTAHWQGKASYYWDLYPDQKPSSVWVTPSGPNVINISYTTNYDSHVESDGATTAALQILPSYSCNVTFSANIITVAQHIVFRVYVRFDSSSETVNVVDTTITDEYTISVDQNGSLQTTKTSSKTEDHSQSPYESGILNFFTNLNNLMDDIKKNISAFSATKLKSIPFDHLQNFIFPGARVFTFKSAMFSTGQDLLCAITYVDPSSVKQATPKLVPVAPGVPIPSVTSSAGTKPVPPNKNTIPPSATIDPSSSHGSHSQSTVAPGFPTPSGTNSANSKPIPLDDSTTPSNSKMEGIAGASPAGSKPIQLDNGKTPSNGKSSGTASLGSYSLTYSSELMQNYIQGGIVSPQGKFEALQTSDGHALLFAISTSGVLNVVAESSGTSRTGWVDTDLSTVTIQNKFPGATVRTFDVGQSALDGTIGLAIAVSSGGSDHLFVSLSNSNSNTSWITQPGWVAYPFDAPNENQSTISITSILFSESINKQQYLIVDINRSSVTAVKEITRYYIDPSKSGGTCWVRHDVPVDIESGNYQSCVGRKVKTSVDGVYTIGKSGTSSQFVYVPIINAFGSGPPTPSRLSLPGGITASAIAASRNEDPNPTLHGTTDVYVIGGSTLYCFDAQGQRIDGAVGRSVLTNAMFAGTSQLIAMTHGGVTTLWGRNGSDVVYYTSCPTKKVHVSGSWGVPIPVLTGVENISAYVNRSDGGNTIFAAGGGKLQKMVQATTTSSKMWQAQAITLATQSTQPALSFKSYTTTLQLSKANNIPAQGVSVALSAKSRTPVYINSLYYTLGQVPLNVLTNNNGSLIIVEAVTKINGTILKVSAGGAAALSINPMEKSFNKLATLNTRDSLKNTTIPQGIKAGGVMGPAQSKPFVSSSISDDDLNTAASSIVALTQAYHGLDSPKVSAAESRVALAAPTKSLVSIPGLNSIEAGAGDLYQWGASEASAAFDSAVQIIHDAASNTWSFVTTIAGQAYHAILDSIEAVVGAAEWIFNKLKIIIEDVLLWLEFLFVWDDIRRTKDIMCSLMTLYIQDVMSGLKEIQPLFDGKMAGLESEVNNWAGINGWPTFGSSGAAPLGSSATNAAQNLTSPAQMLLGHFTDNADSMSIQSDLPSMSVAQDIVQDLLTALEQEGAVLGAVGQQLQALAAEITTMSANDVVKRLVGILADGILSSAQVVIDCLLKVLCELSSTAMDLLTQKVHIPVISDILNALGVSDLSIVDLFCWIAAGITTLGYMATHEGSAPFPDDALVNRISSAPNWTSLSTLMSQPPTQAATSSTKAMTINKLAVRAVSKDAQPQSTPDFVSFDAKLAFMIGHGFAGCYQLIKTVIQPIEAMEEDGNNALSIPCTVVGVMGAISAFIGNYLGLQEPEAEWLLWMSRATTGVTIAAQIALSGPVVRRLGLNSGPVVTIPPPKDPIKDPRQFSSYVNLYLAIPAFICSCAHLRELDSPEPGYDPEPARLEEGSNMANFLARWMYTLTVDQSVDPSKKPITVALLCVSNITITALQLTEGFDSNI